MKISLDFYLRDETETKFDESRFNIKKISIRHPFYQTIE